MPQLAIYPGSFDPPTNGHVDVITRAARISGTLIVAVLNNTAKQPVFTLAERVSLLRELTSSIANVEIACFDGLLVDFAAQRSADAIIRGMRTLSDYESEVQMALINRRLRPHTETLFLMASEEHSAISSRMIKEIAILGGEVSQFVPEPVAFKLREKFGPAR